MQAFMAPYIIKKRKSKKERIKNELLLIRYTCIENIANTVTTVEVIICEYKQPNQVDLIIPTYCVVARTVHCVCVRR